MKLKRQNTNASASGRDANEAAMLGAIMIKANLYISTCKSIRKLKVHIYMKLK